SSERLLSACKTSIRNSTIASIGFLPALLFLTSSGVSTTASISARKLSHGTSRSIASSGSPFADSAANRCSASKNPNCPILASANHRRHERDSHRSAAGAIFRGALYDNPVGTRRAIISVGRKNAKTCLSACLLLAHLIGPPARSRPNSQLYSAAQSREQ